jgi:hypothetical protein
MFPIGDDIAMTEEKGVDDVQGRMPPAPTGEKMND